MIMNDESENVVYVYTVRNRFLISYAKSIDEFINAFEKMAEKMRKWKELGIKLEINSAIEDDYAEFYTHDKDIAIKAGFIYEDKDGSGFLETRSR